MSLESSVSVVIVNYNTRDALARCLDSLSADLEVIVVDNASSDGSAEFVRKRQGVKLIQNLNNLGFGRANNLGIRAATRPLVLLLNSDAWATPDAIATLASVFQDEGVVAAGGMLLNPDGSLQESCGNPLTLWAVFCEQTGLEKLFPSSEVLSPYWMTRRLLAPGGTGPRPVAQIMGACLMMRPKEIFDERFFLYCEDTELCLRLHRYGRILYVPKARFYHELGVSGSSARWRSVAMYNVGKELYFRIHHGRFAAALCQILDRFGALWRALAASVLALCTLGVVKGFRVKSSTFWRVLFAPGSYERLVSEPQ